MHRDFPLIVAANRDEHHSRPTEPLSICHASNIVAGRDVRMGGTWMGLGRNRRFAAITNIRESGKASAGFSRGLLVQNFLMSDLTAPEYIDSVATNAANYAGFNLLLHDNTGLYHFSNWNNQYSRLANGVYAVTNNPPGTECWPKARLGIAALQAALQSDLTPAALFNLLADRTPAADDELPRSSASLALERALSCRFVTTLKYGTRASTVVLVDRSDAAIIAEKTFNHHARETLYREYNWNFS
jgi:uncharacterized protein with NRDE domain